MIAMIAVALHCLLHSCILVLQLLTRTMQDVLARHMRLRTGAAVLLPGLDHAGIATQVNSCRVFAM